MILGNLRHVERVLFAVAAIIALIATIVLHWQKAKERVAWTGRSVILRLAPSIAPDRGVRALSKSVRGLV
jgi:hypothetical protein